MLASDGDATRAAYVRNGDAAGEIGLRDHHAVNGDGRGTRRFWRWAPARTVKSIDEIPRGLVSSVWLVMPTIGVCSSSSPHAAVAAACTNWRLT